MPHRASRGCGRADREDAGELGQIDVLVCNAAINPYYGPMTGLSDEAFDKVMETNVRSNLWLANLVQPEMAARRDGAIIIVSSIGGLRGTNTLGIYAISKAADMQLARNLAVEWGPHNIRVNCIAPGLVKTDFAKALWDNPKLLEMTEQRTPLRRIGEPDDIAGAAVFLASRAGRWITGQTIVIDGGVTIDESRDAAGDREAADDRGSPDAGAGAGAGVDSRRGVRRLSFGFAFGGWAIGICCGRSRRFR